MKPPFLTDRIAAFFVANKGEALTYDDICRKFGVTNEQARSAVKSLRERRNPPILSKACIVGVDR